MRAGPGGSGVCRNAERARVRRNFGCEPTAAGHTFQRMPRHVVIAGGGIAGLEALLALRDLAEDRVRITLVSPDPEFEVKPLRTAEPFSVDHVHRYDLADVCRRRGAEFVQDAVVSVAPE